MVRGSLRNVASSVATSLSTERLLVTIERGFHFGDDLRQVDLHGFLHGACGARSVAGGAEACDQNSGGRIAAATPWVSSACAMRSATSSRHGAAMICTAIGNGVSGTGTATTGSPMNEIGWV